MGQYEGLEAFRLAKFRLKLQPKESLVLSAYPGFTFRGGFGYAFKRITCPFAPNICPPCCLPAQCLYHYVFHTAPPPTYEGRLGVALEFHVLLRSLLRRLWLLGACHCGTLIRWDAKQLIEQANTIKTEQSALEWREWERYSTRQKTSMLLGGFQGSITFAGDLQPFLPMLLLGTHVHVGKGATFGLGQYEIGRGRNPRGNGSCPRWS